MASGADAVADVALGDTASVDGDVGDEVASAFSCANLASKCPLGPPPPQEAIDACNQGLASATCRDLTIAAFGCMTEKEVCTADSHDEPATAAACKTETDALKACLANP